MIVIDHYILQLHYAYTHRSLPVTYCNLLVTVPHADPSIWAYLLTFFSSSSTLTYVLRLSDALQEDPSLSSSGSIRKGFVLCLHGCTRDSLCVRTRDTRDVLCFGVGTMVSIVIYIVPIQAAVEKIVVSLNGV